MLKRNQKKIPLISICIPTFNRFEKVYKLVNDLLLYPGHDIEVIVLDNCSTDETKDLSTKIIDERFSFIRNDENIGGVLNLLKSISLATGKFAILCLDKDYLDYRIIEKLITNIHSDPEVIFGHCALNIQKEGQDIVFNKGYDSIQNMSYLSRHPTGTFYRSNEYKSLPLLKEIFLEKRTFPFYTDMINAEMAMLGKSQFINLPSFYTESKEEAVKSPSFTYDISNVYFSPTRRIIEFDTYVEHAQKLMISSFEKFKLIFKLYGQELMFSTFLYSSMVADDAVCSHNRIAKQKVGFIGIWKLNFAFTKHFLKHRLTVNILQKVVIILLWDFKFFIKSILFR